MKKNFSWLAVLFVIAIIVIVVLQIIGEIMFYTSPDVPTWAKLLVFFK